MKRVFLIAVTLLTVVGAGAQNAGNKGVKWQVPDDEAIKVAVLDTASRFYYPRLMDRYMKGDESLDADDYRHLYYGFAFQSGYRPLDPLKGEKELLMEMDAGIDSLNARKVVELAGVVMQGDPFNPGAVNLMTYAYGLMGDEEGARRSAARLAGIVGAIVSSGDGESKGTAWHVLWFTHVNDFLAMKGYVPRSRSYVSSSVEYVLLKDSYRRNKGLYFNIGRVYSRPPTVIPEKPRGVKVVW